MFQFIIFEREKYFFSVEKYKATFFLLLVTALLLLETWAVLLLGPSLQWI